MADQKKDTKKAKTKDPAAKREAKIAAAQEKKKLRKQMRRG